MSTVVFVYTQILILVCFAAAMFSLAAYAVSHKRSLVPQASFFVFYIIELIGILGVEFTSQNLTFDVGSYYEITIPALRIITSTGVMASLWIMLLDILDVHDKVVQFVPVGLFVVASCVVVWGLPYGQLRQWLFYTLRQVWIAFGLAYAFLRWHRSTDMPYRERLGKLRNRYLLLWLLLVATLLEDSYVILLAPVPKADANGIALYLSERNISETVMMLWVAYHVIRGSLATLALRFATPPVAPRTELVVAKPAAEPSADDAAGEQAGHPDRQEHRGREHRGRQADKSRQAADDLVRHIGDQLPAFASAHGLSDREREVLALVIEGKTNREIAAALFLSEGTIKTHVHNITKKCGTTNRATLRQAFWAS